MHLKLDTSVSIDDGDVARDLGQATADIVVLSAADSDLAAFGAARAGMPDDYPTLQLTNFLALGHPASVDLYVERTLSKAKLVILRMLGGEAYWPHGVDSLRRDALARGAQFVCIPGEMEWNAELAARGTADLDDARALWRYCSEGGADNISLALRYAAWMILRDDCPPPPRPMPAAGFWPAEPRSSQGRRALVIFYRALAASGDTAAIAALRDALAARDFDPTCIFVTSLKDARSIAFLRSVLAATPPDVIINATAFATATATDDSGVLASADCPILQVAQAGVTREHWEQSGRGLNPRDLAMHVVLPEVDGRVFAGAVAFKQRGGDAEFAPTVYQPLQDRIDAVADLAQAWVRLRHQPRDQRRVAIVLANYPNRDGRLGNGVGLDTPQSLHDLLFTLRTEGYLTRELPADTAALMEQLQRGPTNELQGRSDRDGGVSWPMADYAAAFAELPQAVREAVTTRWGAPEHDPHVAGGDFRLGLHRFGNILVGVQPARGYAIDPKSSFHDPELPPPHHYVAFYLWLRQAFGADAVIHLGKHGNLEWLPGKSAGLSRDCFPTALLGPLPHLYPFIVNDPGEGIQAKRRTAAVIVDHLTPPMTRAELHDEMAQLEALVDEYAMAADLDPTRADAIAEDIISLARATRLDEDVAIDRDTATLDALRAIDAHLCDLKEMQIRDGLHVFGRTPQASQCDELLVSIARLPRSELKLQDASLHRAMARDLGLTDADGAAFDPLTRDLVTPYTGPRPPILAALSDRPWRTSGDTIERLEALALRLVAGASASPEWPQAGPVLEWIATSLRPAIEVSGGAEREALLRGLDGRFIRPGPSGAPTRGRPDVLPTGRNFFAVDVRAVPTPSAWRIGQLAAERLIESYWQEAGEWPRSIALSAWGTANMRTGGDDVAQALALIGARPTWEDATGRVTGFAIVPLSELRRPRVDVTFRVSGLFRDAFPVQMDLIASAVAAVAALDEPDDANPIAAQVRLRSEQLVQSGVDPDLAKRQAGARVFGARPGSYGAGLQAMIDDGGWDSRNDLAGAYLAWGGYAYGAGQDGAEAADAFATRLQAVDLVAQAQDNREHDILDSDDYYQFIGGLAAAVESLRGQAPRIAHVDTSRPEAPLPRTLAHEISRVVRGRAANPKWIQGVMRHGYKGASEIAATVDYLFGFAASTDAVGNRHFDLLFAAYLEDDAVRQFLQDANPAALRDIVARFDEAIRRGLWTPRSNRAADLLAEFLTPKEAA
ncbi:cobaltochelatase CobN subunit [Rhodopseudomonas thermotolerans]|uniref:Cobaltochelatase subunit CobN n=2 Tax=Rhodopseudomonas TaxID=1073 RepID=A0A336JJF3_9BRAD|nr:MULTISPECIES: cobaltochelatase subunit CobN [Rhodopseudomonas]RED38407.1 cobaltochelatase CobN subunit [Rhodopseudomonas pentothenatexigens]REG05992.1 cobaltochelatase CobN subunit [Rhodopseudomonas thermotolerans]SSW89860.1 cobaltochelatase CobN subunit [Rhodopseudomonas pentothenatexigens]